MLEIENGNVTELHVHSIDRLGKNTIDILSTINLITSSMVAMLLQIKKDYKC
jgi:DNA invertase Pin-like site-specific DNA recombinase